jgi:hypothetical protein
MGRGVAIPLGEAGVECVHCRDPRAGNAHRARGAPPNRGRGEEGHRDEYVNVAGRDARWDWRG